MSKRKQATEKAIELLSKFAGYNESVQEIERMLNELTDEQFEEYMQKLYNEQEILPYIAPNLNNVGINSKRNIEIAEEIGHDFFERLWLTDSSTGQTYLTPIKYMVVDLPLKRLQQHLEKKLKVAEDDRHIDDRTGTVALGSESKGSSLSFPELQVLYSQGLDRTIEELFQVRGGDEKSYREFKNEVIAGGVGSMDASRVPDSRARSTDIISIYLTSAHIRNNL